MAIASVSPLAFAGVASSVDSVPPAELAIGVDAPARDRPRGQEGTRNPSPTATLTASVTPATSSGVVTKFAAKTPRPPQQATSPVARAAHVCVAPAETSTAW